MSLQNIKYLIDALSTQEDKYEIKEIKKEIISIVISYKKDEEITVNEVFKDFCNVNKIKESDFFINTRKRKIIEPKQAFSFLAHKIYKFTSIETGNLLQKDHATILHSCRLVTDQYKYYKKWLVVWETEINNYLKTN